MRRSHVFASVLVGLCGVWGVDAAMAAAPRLAPDPVTLGLPFTQETGPDALWLAQSSSSNNLSPAQQEQVDELLRQGQARVGAKDYAGAIAIYQQAAQVDGQNPRIFSGIAYLYMQQGDYDQAIVAYRRAIALDRDNLPFHYGLAHSLYQDGQLDEAVATYRSILALNPREANAYLGIGSIQLQQADNEAALATYQELVRVIPGNAQAYEALGTLYSQQENYEQALVYLQQGLRSSSNNKASLYVSIANIHYLQGNVQAARENLDRALAADASNALAQNQMGYLVYQEGDREAAFEHLMRAVRLDPDLVAAHALLGSLLLEREQYLQAVLSYRKVTEARPNDPAAFYNLGLALWGQGMQAQAMSNVELAEILYNRQGDSAGAERARELINFWAPQRAGTSSGSDL